MFMLLLWGVSPIASALPESVTGALKRELAQRVLSHYPSAELTVEIKDQQQLYKPCEAPTVEISGQNLTGRIPIRVRCHGTAAWSYFAQAQVSAREEIVVASHPIKRGTVITAQDLELIATEIDSRRRYFTHVKPIVGSLAARSMSMGQPIQARHLDKPLAVKRGDTVVIQARHGAATISAQGKALKSGHIGEQIPVENSNSARVIHTWIVAKGLVATRAARS